MLLAVTQLAAERSLPPAVVLSAVRDALVMAYKRDRVARGQDVAVDLNSETGEVVVRTVKHVVEVVEDPATQLTLEEARKLDPHAEIDSVVTTGHIDANPGRIAAQTAKQLVMQRLRDAERELVYDEYASKEGEVVSAVVQRVDARFVTLDLSRSEAIMPPSEQVPGEHYRPGLRIKVYIVEVRRTARGPEIVASRTHTELLRRLFETEVPEIFNGIVEIRAIAREPGARSKVAVTSNQPGVDPVGACVGLRGIRIQNVVNELLGEKIDVIEWDENLAAFIANSLSPAQVEEVRLNPDDGSAVAVVPDRHLSLAIGREGQNVRLAAKLTNSRIDIQSVSEAAAAVLSPAPEPVVETPVAAGETPGAETPTPVAETADAAVETPAEELAASGQAAAQVETPAAETAAAAPVQEALEPEEAVKEAAPPEEEPLPFDKTAEPRETGPEEPPEEARETGPEEPEEEKAPEAPEQPAMSPEEELALLSLEEEIAALEEQERREEEARARRQEELVASSPVSDVIDDDIWQVTDLPVSEPAGQIRFAEDLVDFRQMPQGRRRGRGRRGGDNLSPKARRAAARRAQKEPGSDRSKA